MSIFWTDLASQLVFVFVRGVSACIERSFQASATELSDFLIVVRRTQLGLEMTLYPRVSEHIATLRNGIMPKASRDAVKALDQERALS